MTVTHPAPPPRPAHIIEVDEEPDSSITATAPRINSANMPIAILGNVEIRNLPIEDDEMNDETEVRARPISVPPSVPDTVRASPPAPAPSQPPRPPRAPAPAAGVASSQPPSTEPGGAHDDDGDDDDGVTREGPAPRVASSPELIASLGAPLTPPLSSGPTTEPQRSSTAGGFDVELATQKRAAIVLAPLVIDDENELPTSPGITEPPRSPSLEDPPTNRRGIAGAPHRQGGPIAKKAGAAATDGYANDEDDDDARATSTARGRGSDHDRDDEQSVTTQGPARSGRLLATPDVQDDGSDSTQKMKRHRREVESPADSEPGSITSQAPVPLTNMLRVIASDSDSRPDLSSLDPEDDQPENRTAVMPNAPLKRLVAEHVAAAGLPEIRPTGPPLTMPQRGAQASAAAPQLEPLSDSGLRVARAGAGSGEHASHGVLGVAADRRPSGVGVAAGPPSDGALDVRPFAPTEHAFPPQPSLHDVDLGRGPRYDILVAVVAAISVIVPVTLFLVLQQGGEEVSPPRVAAEPAPQLVKRADEPRSKWDRSSKTKPPASASGSAAPSGSGAPPHGAPPIKR